MSDLSLLENTLISLAVAALLAATVVLALAAGYLMAALARAGCQRQPNADPVPHNNIHDPGVQTPDPPGQPQPEALPAGGLLAAATFQGGKTYNQDSYFCEEFGACKVIVIADGVSSSDYASLASRQVTQTFYRALHRVAEHDEPFLTPEFFTRTCRLAARRIAAQVPDGFSAETTLILLAEFSDRFLLAYLGDGGAVWVRGNLREGKSLLLAHHDQYGRLCGFVGREGPSLAAPTIVEISKSQMEDGDILLVGTDGALPPRKEAGHAFTLLSELLAQTAAKGDTPTAAEVGHHIGDYLARRQPDDNATLGILFTRQAFAYWQHQSRQVAEGKENGHLTSAFAAQPQPNLRSDA